MRAITACTAARNASLHEDDRYFTYSTYIHIQHVVVTYKLCSKTVNDSQ